MEQVLAKCIQPLMIDGTEIKEGDEIVFDHEHYQHYVDTSFGLMATRSRDRYSIAMPHFSSIPFPHIAEIIYSFFDKRTCEEEEYISIDGMGNKEPLHCFDDFFKIIPQLNK